MSPQELRDESEVAPFGDHLDDLRKHLIRSFIAIIVLAIIAFVYKDIIFDKIILYPKHPEFFTNKLFCKLGHLFNTDKLCINELSYSLINLELAGQFKIHMMLSLIAGFILGFPYLAWEVWTFVKPALSEKEVQNTRGIVFFISFLFIVGLLFGYYLISPFAINFFSTYSVSDTLVNQFKIQSYISILTTTTLSTGLAFELPIVVFFLSKMGFTTPKGMRKYRKHAIIVLLFISAILTPADPFTMFLVAIPLYVLYEISIRISKAIYKEHKEQGYIVE